MPVPTVSAAISNARMGWINVLDYGAVGDGIVNDSAAVQRAVDALATAGTQVGGTIMFPGANSGAGVRGFYKLTSAVTLRPGITIRGTGPGSTRVQSSGFSITGSPGSFTNLCVADISVVSLSFTDCARIRIDNVTIDGAATGLTLDDCDHVLITNTVLETSFATRAITILDSSHISIHASHMNNSSVGAEGMKVTNSKHIDVRASLLQSAGLTVNLEGCEHVVIEACKVVFGSGGTAIKAQTTVCNRCAFRHNEFNGTAGSVIDFTPGSLGHGRIVITGNDFLGMGAGDYCFNPGSTTTYRFDMNEKDGGTYVNGSANGTVVVDVP